MGKVPKRIQSIKRSAALLEIIAQQGGGARVRELAAISGLEKTTAHNILQTLEHLGYVYRRTGDVRYYLGGRILNLSRLVGDDDSIRRKLRPVMDRLAAECRATAYLGVSSGDQVAYLDIVDLENPYMANSRLDRREKLEGSAVGLVFLAFVPGLGQRVLSTRANALNARAMDEIESVRNKGYALDLGAYHPGINAVAVPWRQTGEVRASLCLARQATDFPRHRMVHMAWKMMKALEGANLQQC